MAKSAKRKAPSRIRSEQSNPTVSCRVTRDIYQKLQAAKKGGDRSFAHILKVGLRILEPQIRRESEIRKKGYAEAYEKAFAEAVRLYRVVYSCSICGESTEVRSEEAKRDEGLYMREHGWGHKACHEKGQ